MPAACCCAVADPTPVVGSVISSESETRVVAEQTAQRVVRAEEVVVGEPAVVAELERVVYALRLRHGGAERREAGRILNRRPSLARVADDVDLIALRVDGADVLDRAAQVVVDVVRRHHAVAIELVLDAAAGAVLRHRLGIRVDALAEGRHAAIAAAALRHP